MAPPRNEIYNRLRVLVADGLGVDEDEVTWDANIYDDLNADAVEFHDEVISRIEDEFEVTIDDADVPDLTTIREMVAYIAENM
ncbi:MAG TPA: acyl carrier protein [Chloroflexia bacterium]|jgi:acyl carrier protein|nr:acyl carrier protein [Chloroflexia bacterium]